MKITGAIVQGYYIKLHNAIFNRQRSNDPESLPEIYPPITNVASANGFLTTFRWFRGVRRNRERRR